MLVAAVALCIVVIPVVALLVDEVDWHRLFGGPNRRERALRQRAAEAHEAVNAVFASATTKMQRRTGSGDMFNLGSWRKW